MISVFFLLFLALYAYAVACIFVPLFMLGVLAYGKVPLVYNRQELQFLPPSDFVIVKFRDYSVVYRRHSGDSG